MTDIGVLGDRYEIESTLGHGGMATVYRGRDRVLGRPVAIKVLDGKYAGDEKFVTRFRREARAAAGLNHKNVVAVFDTGDTNGRHYIVMEIVEGETLAHLLKREGPLSPQRAARIAGITAAALQAAHDQGLIHRDVKPGNVMLTRDGDVKVMDFGIARAATDDTLTQTGMVLGTASYLSPEQSRGEPIDHRSDVYSLGCVLYEMLTGRPPFAGDSAVGVAYKHVHERPDAPSGANPAVPADLEAVVMRALEKDPSARQPSADAFREDLTAAVAGELTEPLAEATAILPLSDAEATQPLSHRPTSRRWLPAALLGALVLITGIFAVFALTGDDARERGGEEPLNQEPTPPPGTPVEEAFLSLSELIDANEGLLPPGAGGGILAEADLAVEAYEAGDTDEALGHLDVADAVIEAAVLDGTLPEEGSAALYEGVDLLRMTMQPAPSPVEESPLDEEGDEDCESSGPGNSGCAPGHEKKDED